MAWLVVGTLVCATAAGFVGDRQGGSAQAILDETSHKEGILTTAVLETSDLERDSFGQFRFEGWGARPARFAPVALRSEISLLHEHRDRVRDRHGLDLRQSPFPDLPARDDQPPRMDSGHPDPDRLLPSSQPVLEDAQ
jgi:hypothetical protein